MRKMKRVRSKLSESVLRVCLVFTICLSLGVGIVGFSIYTNGMMDSYQDSLTAILNYVTVGLNGDDIEQCINTLTPSDEFFRAQRMLNRIKEYFEVEYIYIMRPLRVTGEDNMLYVMTGVTQKELEEDPKQTTLGDFSGDQFDEKVSRFYMDCMENGDGIRFFDNRTSFGYMYTGMIPIKNTQGDNVAILSVDISVDELVTTVISYILFCVFGWMILSTLFLWMLFRWMKKRVIQPVQEMEKAAKQFVDKSRNNDAGPEELNFNLPDIHTGDEIQSLSDALCKMSDDVKNYMSNMLVQTREKERIASELNVATQIQADMLPNIFPPFPDKREFEIYATMDPAKEVGGDFYDFFLVDDTHLAMVMADVSGKGVPAALFMVIAKTLIKTRAQAGGTPSEILEDVNNRLCEGNKSQLFVTVWLGIIDITTGKGAAANAGHEHPVIRRKDGTFELVKYRHSPALAAMESIPFRQHEFEMQAGDELFVYTDGVPEATDKDETMFGTDRMLASLNANRDRSLTERLLALRSDIEEFVGDAPQFDDITMLGFKYIGQGDERDMKELQLSATLENLNAVNAFVEEQLEAHECPMKASMQIMVALEEMYVNIAHYAYGGKEGPATVQVEKKDDTILIRLIDEGKPFDPVTKADPDVSLSAEERKIGGLGIFMVKKTMDVFKYERTAGRNVVTFGKKVQ